MGDESKKGTIVSEPKAVAKAEDRPPAPETISELDAYRRMVADVAAAADGRVIMNRTVEHAAVVVENVVRHANGVIDIVTRELHSPVYSTTGVLTAVSEFLGANPDRQVRIVAERPIDHTHPFLRAIMKYRPDFKLKVMPPALEKNTPFHFCVADGRSFRFEPNKQKFEAYGQFGEPVIGKKLTQTFERLQADSDEV